MRAQKVYEVLDFERGGDPKENMGVGLMNKLKQEIFNNPRFTHGGFDMHEYLRDLIKEYGVIIFDLIKNILRERPGTGTNIFHHMVEVYLYFMENDETVLNDVIEMDPKEFLHRVSSDYSGISDHPNQQERDVLIKDFYERVSKIVPAQKLWTYSLDNNSIGLKAAFNLGANPKIGKIKPYLVSIIKRDIELLRILLKHGVDPDTLFPRPGRKEVNYPIRRAAFDGWVEGFKELLADPRTDPSDKDNSALINVVREIQALEKKEENKDNNLVFATGRNWDKDDASIEDYVEIQNLLLADHRVQSKLHFLPKSISTILKDKGHM